MKKLMTTLMAGLLLTTSLPTLAGPFNDRYDRHDRHSRGERHEHPRSHHRPGPAWGVLGAGLALGGVMLALDASRPPVMVAPLGIPSARPPEHLWYYCASYRAYYPYVNYCPEGWRVVPAAPY